MNVPANLISFDIEIIGLRARIASNDEEIIARARDMYHAMILPPEGTNAPVDTKILSIKDPESSTYISYSPQSSQWRSQTPEETVVHIKGLIKYFLWSSTSDHLLLHAAGVANDGKGIILTAPSQTGKTTLTIELVRSGYDYLAEEMLPYHYTEKLLGYFPESFTIRQKSFELIPELLEVASAEKYQEFNHLKKWIITPSSITSKSAPKQAEPRCLFLLKQNENDTPQLEKLAPQAALAFLSRMCFNFKPLFRKNKKTLMKAITNLIESVDCYTLRLGAVRKTIDLIEHFI